MRTAGIAIIKSGVPVLTIIPERLRQRIIDTLGGSEESINLAVSSIASFYDVIVNSLGGEVRVIETDLARIYVLQAGADTKILLFVPGRIEADENLLRAIIETVKNASDLSEIESRLTRLLETINRPEAEFLPEDRDETEAFIKALEKVEPKNVTNFYKIALAILAPAGIPNASFFPKRSLGCIDKPPEIDPAKANEIIEEILNKNVYKAEVHIEKPLKRIRKFSGGSIYRVNAPDYDRILSCYQRLKDRKRTLEVLMKEFSKRVTEYINKRPNEIEEELAKKREYLEMLRKRLKESRKKIEEEIFVGIFGEEYDRARDLYSVIEERKRQIEEYFNNAPKEPPKGLSEFKERLGELYSRIDKLNSVLSSIGAEAQRVRDEILAIEESIRQKEASHNRAVEEELSSLNERIKLIEESIANLEEELSNIERIKYSRSKNYKKLYKKASKLLNEINKALEEFEKYSMPYTSAAFIVYAFETPDGIKVYVPEIYKRRSSSLEELAKEAILSGVSPVSIEEIKSLASKAIAKKGKKFEKKLRKAFPKL